MAPWIMDPWIHGSWIHGSWIQGMDHGSIDPWIMDEWIHGSKSVKKTYKQNGNCTKRHKIQRNGAQIGALGAKLRGESI